MSIMTLYALVDYEFPRIKLHNLVDVDFLVDFDFHTRELNNNTSLSVYISK